MVITICGSMKFKEQMMKDYNKLTAKGFSVYIPYMGDEDKMMEGEVDIDRVNNLLRTLQKVHEYKIENSDAIFVVDQPDSNPDVSYIGFDTKREIEFAIAHHVDVIFKSNFEKSIKLKEEIINGTRGLQ